MFLKYTLIIYFEKKFIKIEKTIKIINYFFIKNFLKQFTFFVTYDSISLTKKKTIIASFVCEYVAKLKLKGEPEQCRCAL